MFSLYYDTELRNVFWKHKHDGKLVKDLTDPDVNHDLDQEIVDKLIDHKFHTFDESVIPKTTWDGLHDYQRDGVKFIVKHGGRALIADQMGTGKTRQAIVASLYYKDDFPVIIVCPASLCQNWKNEISNVCDYTVQVIKKTSDSISPKSKFIILSYGKLISQKFLAVLCKVYWPFVIMDECHYVKNAKSQRTKVAMKLCANAKRVLALSGTPMNKPKDIYSISKCVCPKLFTRFYSEHGKAFHFSNRYCNPRKQHFSGGNPVDHSGSARPEELNAILKYTMLLCRTKDEVMTLPEKIRETVTIGENPPSWLKNNKAYLAKVREESKLLHDAKFMNMVMETSKKKTKFTIGFFKTILLKRMEEDESLKVIIFGNYIQNLTAISEFFATTFEESPYNFITIDGRTPVMKRQDMVDKFQNDPLCRVAVLGIKACGAGLTLTAASQVYMTDMMFNPEDCLQAEDRAHRHGQDSHVTITYLIMGGSTDQMLFDMISRKFTVCSQVIENKKRKLEVINR